MKDARQCIRGDLDYMKCLIRALCKKILPALSLSNASPLAPNLRSDSESDYSASCSEEEEEEDHKETGDVILDQKTSIKTRAAPTSASKKTPAKKRKKEMMVSVEEIQP